MLRFSRITQTVLTALFIGSSSLSGIQPAVAQSGGGGDHTRHSPAGRASSNGAASLLLPNSTLVASSIQDPSFEAFTPNPFWAESSTNFGTPLCMVDVCGTAEDTAGPHTGLVWGWFGGTPNSEAASLSQSAVFNSGTPDLLFYLWIGVADTGSGVNDAFQASVDGIPVFSTNATQRNLYAKYKPVIVDVSAFADGGTHTLAFSSRTRGQVVNFNLDDVSLIDAVSTAPFPNALDDGWIRESREFSNKGGALDSTGQIFKVGDDALNRQFRGILSFDTTLPAGAVIVSAKLMIRKAGLVGTNPFMSLGDLVGDIATGSFNGNPALEAQDFQAPASKTAGFKFGKVAAAGWFTASIPDRSLPSINPNGTTQFRLRYAIDDNNNGIADYFKFFTGEAPTPSNVPVLSITYYIP